MIRGFADKVTEDLYHGKNSKDARRIPKSIWKIVQRKLDLLNRAILLGDLRVPPSNRLEKLRRDLEGCHSIRVNDQYRIVFAFRDGDAHDVRVLDYR
ncbi:MAG: type II toxin-antitoxin system RelE/ParE family toxin [Deltaproteobacteria bacterium]|nr:type II toxin-antitoxin system RelE/ParE family toxin [Deltaproteobacteria bacterium]MBW2191662.1 type II toxin-antitoxin system RelE/ParE family toxin [Deltaproteobacteria bacterium]MBW2719761.1 type II toxin-antitoxin system RelE/ParE family toxin [Deltaproteobacteria bacterium]RLB49178.1 MAG: type II toxin-antitoxin system RelE/ParE family toxin [Deltaproteobacteria bacterium]